MLGDLRYALRSLRKSPGFAAVAVLSLGVGLGLVTTMFGLLDAVKNPYVPYRDGNRLYDVRYWMSARDQRFSPAWVVSALRERTRAFEAILPYGGSQMSLGMEGAPGADEGPEVNVARVPPQLFAVLGVRPSRGRGLESADAAAGAAVVSDGFWRHWLAGRRSLESAYVVLGGQRYAVVGVMPSGMRFPWNASVWVALPDSLAALPRDAAAVMVKLRPGVTREGASAELAAIAAYLTHTYHVEGAPFAFYLNPLRNDPMGLTDIHFAMLGAALAVLLIACANLANLELARGLAKRRELALRMAIGASRSAVVRQMFAECVVLAVAGAALGVVLSVWGVRILRANVPRQLWWLGIVQPRLSWRVFALAVLAAAGAAAVAGLVPAIRVARAVSLDEPLKDGAGTTGRTRQRYSWLVITEIALALALTMGAGLLLKVAHRLASYEFNFPARQLLRAGIFLPKYSPAAPKLLDVELAAVAALRTVPGVVDAAAEAGTRLPGGAVTAEMGGDSIRLLPALSVPVVTPGYLRTFGLPVLEGRDFEEGDLVGDGVAILNSAAAAQLYPGEPAVGRMVKLGAPARHAPWLRIVGVCRTRQEGSQGSAWFAPQVYVVGKPDSTRRLASVFIRTAREDPGIAKAVQAKLKTLPQGVGRWTWPYLAGWEAKLQAQRFVARLFVVMGAFALLLAALGIHGILAYAVSRRLREFAVRIAVGAERADMLKLVVHDGMVMTLAGTGLGAFLAFYFCAALNQFLEGQQVQATDALTLVAAELVLIAVAVAAMATPAFRAMRADPIEILRAT